MTSVDQTPPSRAPLFHRLLGLLCRIFAWTIRIMPAFLSYLLADLLALGLIPFVLLHERKVSAKGRGLFRNQRIVFRDTLTRGQSWRLFFGWARHMCRLLIDVCRMPKITAANVERHVDIEQFRELQQLVEAGDGLIAVTGHVGVWEMAGHVASLLGVTVNAVFRPLPIQPIDEMLQQIRTSGGQVVLSKWGALWPLKKALDRGEAIGIVGDESARRGTFVPFLGTLASTNTTPARLHLGTGAPIVVFSCHRTGISRFKLHVWAVIRHARTADKQADTELVTRQINAAISESIRAYPAQWFWGSRRYVTRPAGESPGPDGLPPVASETATVADLAPRQ